jgi:hypothetical protein
MMWPQSGLILTGSLRKMSRLLFYSPWFVFIATSITLSLFSLTVFYIGKRFHSLSTDNQSSHLIAHVGILGGAYGVLLGFIIFALWGIVYQARQNLSEEARQLSSIVINSEVLPKKIHNELKKSVNDYICNFLNKERYTMREGHEDLNSMQSMIHLFRVLQAYQPVTSRDQIYYRQILSDTIGVQQARRARLNDTRSVLPKNIYFILILGAFLTMGAISLTEVSEKVDNNKKQIIMLLFLSIGIACNLSVIFTLNFPFSGSINYNYEAFQNGALKDSGMQCPKV